jgi:hypothetical protein
MKRNLAVFAVFGIVLGSVLSAPSASAGSLCNNGRYSSNSGSGTCSSNGGVNKYAPSYSDPGSSSYNRNNGLGGGLGSTGKNGLTGKSCPKGKYIC